MSSSTTGISEIILKVVLGVGIFELARGEVGGVVLTFSWLLLTFDLGGRSLLGWGHSCDKLDVPGLKEKGLLVQFVAPGYCSDSPPSQKFHMLRRTVPKFAPHLKRVIRSAPHAKTTFQKRQLFPNMPITLMSSYSGSVNMPPKAIFRVRPEMTKHEVKEYLTKIYDLPVTKVNTMNFMAKRRVEANGPTTRKIIKESRWKKAIVRFERHTKAGPSGGEVVDVGAVDATATAAATA